MTAGQPDEQMLMAYICGELDDDAHAAIEAALGESPEQASEAMKMLSVWHRLGANRDASSASEHSSPIQSEPLDGDLAQASLDWACGELSPEQRYAIEQLLASHPEHAAEAFRMRHAWRITHDALKAADAPSDTVTSDTRTARRNPALHRTLAVLALAACLAIAAAVWHLSTRTDSAFAYTLADIPHRLRELDSIRIIGQHHIYTRHDQQTPDTVPVEWYVERPHRYWIRTDAWAGPGYEASDGHMLITVDHDNQLAQLGNDIPVAARLRVESYLQNQLHQLIAGDNLDSFAQIDSDFIDDAYIEIHERIDQPAPDVERRTRIWFSPAIGLPVRTEHYQQTGNQPERLHATYDHFDPDATSPPEAFTFTPPENYTIATHDRDPNDAVVASMSRDGERLLIRAALKIDNRAILVAWAHDDGTSMNTALSQPPGNLSAALTFNDTGDLHTHHLHTDPSTTYPWHWSLITARSTDASGRTADTDQLLESTRNLQLTFESDATTFNVIVPVLTFERDNLQHLIHELQYLATPGTTPEHLISLDELDQLIIEHQAP